MRLYIELHREKDDDTWYIAGDKGAYIAYKSNTVYCKEPNKVYFVLIEKESRSTAEVVHFGKRLINICTNLVGGSSASTPTAGEGISGRYDISNFRVLY